MLFSCPDVFSLPKTHAFPPAKIRLATDAVRYRCFFPAVFAIQNVAFDGILFAGQILEHFIQSIGVNDFVRNRAWRHDIIFGTEVDAIHR